MKRAMPDYDVFVTAVRMMFGGGKIHPDRKIYDELVAGKRPAHKEYRTGSHTFCTHLKRTHVDSVIVDLFLSEKP